MNRITKNVEMNKINFVKLPSEGPSVTFLLAFYAHTNAIKLSKVTTKDVIAKLKQIGFEFLTSKNRFVL